MTSSTSNSTSEFTTLTKIGLSGDEQNPLLQRNAISTVKRRQCQRRKILNIVPLRLDEIQKQIEEAANDDSTNLPWEPNFEEKEQNKENEPVANQHQNDHYKSSLQDSFELNFAALSLDTPAKPPEIKHEKFATPCPNYRSLGPSKTSRALDFQYVTPNNKISAKVQCSVSMKPYMKTPMSLYTIDDQEENSEKKSVQLTVHKDLDFKRIKINNVSYVVLNELGKGGSSEVFHCYNPASKTHRAVKVVSLENKASAFGFIDEVQVLKTLQKCNRVIKMFDYEIRKDAVLYVVLEIGEIDLSKILKESALNTTHMPLYMLLYYWMEMLYAVKQIHSQGIIHSDLKPANFLKVEGYLKLIDFGIARCIQNDMTSVFKDVPEGSFNYISPEALSNESSTNTDSPSYGKPKYKLNCKSDVWSLGCILYQFVYRRTPFQHITQLWVKLAAVVDPNHRIEYPKVGWVPPKIINTIKKCLQVNVKSRPSVDDLISEYENMFHNLS